MTSRSTESGAGRIGQRLLRAGLILEEQIDLIIEHQHAHQLRFGSAAFDLGLVEAADVTQVLARQKRCAGMVIEETPVELVKSLAVPVSMLRELQALPCKVFKRTAVIAMADPGDEHVVGALQSVCRQRIQPVLGLSCSIRRHLTALVDSHPAQEQATRQAEPTPAPMALPPIVRAVSDSLDTANRRNEQQARARGCLRDALRALQAEDYPNTVRSAQASMRSDPFDPRATYALARGLYGLKDLSRCLTAVDQTLALDPEHYGAWRLRAIASEGLMLMADAVQGWQRALTLCPDPQAAKVIEERLSVLRSA